MIRRRDRRGTGWGRLAGRLRTRLGAFALGVSSLLLIAAGVALDGWMITLPSNVPTSCTESGVGTYCAESPNPAIQLWLGLVVVALGIGLLVIAWRFDRQPNERPRQGWEALGSWGAPLLWLAVIPIVALPVALILAGWEVRRPSCQIYFFVGATAECPVSTLMPSVVIPGLLNLVPMRWLWTTDPRTRIAAIAASMLGVAGLVGSLWALIAQGPVVTIEYGLFPLALPPPGLSGAGFGTVIWVATLIALLVIAKLPFSVAGGPAGINHGIEPAKSSGIPVDPLGES